MSVEAISFREMSSSDGAQVLAIYAAGIATGNATFEISAPSWDEWDAKHLKHSRVIAQVNGEVIGWAALSPVSARRVYSGVAEHSIYIAPEWRGKGLGKKLLQHLIDESEKNGIWTLQASVFSDNAATLALHKGCGFRIVGVRQRIGKLGTEWRDTLLLERRSDRVGTE
jgi:phosphinothricin acetyltransferase